MMARGATVGKGRDRFTAADAACWRELVAAARQAVAGGGEGRLRRVLPRSAAARVPGEVGPANVCIRLVRLARRWRDETHIGRFSLKAELLELALLAEVLIEVFDPQARRTGLERRDIDG